MNSEQDTERTGGTLSFQWKPGENTTLSIDGLMSKYQVERRDNYILGLSFGRSLAQNGQPMVSVRDIQFDDKGSVEYAVFDGVDVRSEGLVDQFVSKFQQVNLDFEHRFNDKFSMNARAGRSLSRWEGPMRLQTFLDAIDVDNFTLDFRGGRETPLIGFGDLVLSDPNSFRYGPPLADATVLGGFSTQGKPSENITAINTFELSGDWQMTEMFGLKLGAQYRENDFDTHVSNLAPAFTPVTATTGRAWTLAEHHDADRRIWTTSSARERRQAGWRSTRAPGATLSTSRPMISATWNAARTRVGCSKK